MVVSAYIFEMLCTRRYSPSGETFFKKPPQDMFLGCHPITRYKNPSWMPQEPGNLSRKLLWCHTRKRKKKRKSPTKYMKAFVGHLWTIFMEIWENDTSTLEVALFCYLGHGSNPDGLKSWQHRFSFLRIVVTPGNPYLWVWIYQITFHDPGQRP